MAVDERGPAGSGRRLTEKRSVPAGVSVGAEQAGETFLGDFAAEGVDRQ